MEQSPLPSQGLNFTIIRNDVLNICASSSFQHDTLQILKLPLKSTGLPLLQEPDHFWRYQGLIEPEVLLKLSRRQRLPERGHADAGIRVSLPPIDRVCFDDHCRDPTDTAQNVSPVLPRLLFKQSLTREANNPRLYPPPSEQPLCLHGEPQLAARAQQRDRRILVFKQDIGPFQDARTTRGSRVLKHGLRRHADDAGGSARPQGRQPRPGQFFGVAGPDV